MTLLIEDALTAFARSVPLEVWGAYGDDVHAYRTRNTIGGDYFLFRVPQWIIDWSEQGDDTLIRVVLAQELIKAFVPQLPAGGGQ